MATAPTPGFEPEPLEPKSKVLPLHHGGLPPELSHDGRAGWSVLGWLTAVRPGERCRMPVASPRRLDWSTPRRLGGGFLAWPEWLSPELFWSLIEGVLLVSSGALRGLLT